MPSSVSLLCLSFHPPDVHITVSLSFALTVSIVRLYTRHPLAIIHACFPSCPFAPPFALFLLPDDLQQSHGEKTRTERERERVFARTLVRPKFRISTATLARRNVNSTRSLVRNFVRLFLPRTLVSPGFLVNRSREITIAHVCRRILTRF